MMNAYLLTTHYRIQGLLCNKTSDNETISILRRWNKGTVRLPDMTDVAWAVRCLHFNNFLFVVALFVGNSEL